jgi:formylglycine-generating enzyme required for sulfatase activity
MKVILGVLALSVSCRFGLAADSVKAPSGSAAGAAPSTVQTKPVIPAAPDVSTNKPDIKELIKGDSFTNASGMVMIKISSSLWAGKYEVTQEQYKKVAGGNPSQFAGEDHPVDSVSWDDAQAFCAKLSDAERKEELLPEGFAYALPTQAQWESLSAGAGPETAVTSKDGARMGTAPVGSLGANGLGLYDTRGNVWEWCLDPEDKPFRVLRGSGWETSLEVNLRPEFRWYSSPGEKKNTFGFRCVLEPAGDGK